jgi:hypothetical protein
MFTQNKNHKYSSHEINNMKAKIIATLGLGGLLTLAGNANAQTGNAITDSFSCIQAYQSWKVPDNIHSIQVEAAGSATIAYEGEGEGGVVKTTLAVTPGETLYLNVGGWSQFAGYNGGGGMSYYYDGNDYAGYAGAGLTNVGRTGNRLTDTLIVAGGAGGYVVYNILSQYDFSGFMVGRNGGAVSQTPNPFLNSSGSFMQGGDGLQGGGGGGGYMGGGGGDRSPGDGGTSYVTPVGTSNTVYQTGGNQGQGYVKITYYMPAEIPAVAGTISGQATVCSGTNSTTLTLSGYTGTIQWQSSTDNITFDNIVDATAATYTASNLTATTWYQAVVTSGGASETSLAVVITVTPSASAGTVTAGTSPQCIGSTTTYTVSGAVLSGGTGVWSSDNTAVATVDPLTGMVKAIGGGTCNIIYTVTGGCNGTPTASQPYMVISGIDASASSNPVALGSDAILSATISPAISGVTISFNVDPGTGVITTYTAVTNNSGVASTAPISGLSVNLYKVVATTASGCASSNAAYMAVYDPNGSFITGGGWITSPAGALVAQPSLSGKANFGFVAKYKKGKSEVDGNTEFQFQDGNFNFKSSELDAGTLVISGSKGTYRGEGTVNGTGDYGFMVSAVDGQITGGGGTDLFRIKIWDRSHGNTVVYDNNMGKDENGVPTTILGGGSIVIHYAKANNSMMMNTGANLEIANSNSNALTVTGKLTVKAMPNPSPYQFTLVLKSLSKEKLILTVTDITGRTIEQRTDIPANSTIQLGGHYHPGVYIAQFLQGDDKVTLRLIKGGK